MAAGKAEAAWDQRETLRPPPYRGALARVARGLNDGDPLLDGLSVRSLLGHGHGAARMGEELPQSPEPAWADWERLERGQALWRARLGPAFTALGLALLSGFAVARFAVVLDHNGYAQDGETARARYTATGYAITDWFRFDLRDPAARGRRALYTVRGMHALARRRSRALFDADKGEGVPLSQYDLAEVLLGFSAVCMSLIERELGAGVIPREERADMCFFWRYVGYHLGIDDAYNVCNSLDDMDACMEEYMTFTPRRLETLRPCTAELRRTAIEGFGMQTGLGASFWRAAFDMVFSTTRCDIAHLRPPRAFPHSLEVLARSTLLCAASPRMAPLLSAQIVAQRDMELAHPDRARLHRRLARMSGVLHDVLLCRLACLVYVLRHVLGVAAVVAAVRRLRRLVAH